MTRILLVLLLFTAIMAVILITQPSAISSSTTDTAYIVPDRCRSKKVESCVMVKSVDIRTFEYKVVATFDNICWSSNIGTCVICVTPRREICWDKIKIR